MSGVAGEDADLARRWRAAAADPEVDAAIRAMHARIEETVAQRRPLCLASGNCCRFEAFGHRLMVTGLEAAWTATRPETPSISLQQIDEARREGRCPHLDSREGRLCGIRGARPMPCRTFFCDRAATDWQRELHESCLGELKALHDRLGIPYRYLEWRDALALLVNSEVTSR